MSRFVLFALLVFLIKFGSCQSLFCDRLKRQSSAKAWVNGKEIDISKGGTYTDKNGNFVSVNNNGNGVSMVSSNNGGGCSVINNVVHECDGTTRPLTSRDRQMLSDYNQQIGDFFRNMFPPGFPFAGQQSQGNRNYPPFPPICNSCSSSISVN